MVPQFVFAEIRIHASYASHEEAILTIVYVVAWFVMAWFFGFMVYNATFNNIELMRFNIIW
jgi:hypothetical protein